MNHKNIKSQSQSTFKELNNLKGQYDKTAERDYNKHNNIALY